MHIRKSTVSVILPVKNEPQLESMILDLRNELCKYEYEIIVVTGDRSKDSVITYENVKHFTSYGDNLSRAILLGFSVASGSKIIVMDADGSHQTSVLDQMIAELDSHEMVVASRFIKGGGYYTTAFRYATSYVFTKYAQLLGSTLSDPMSGYFGIRQSLLCRIKFKPFTWKVALEINNKLRPTTREIPLTFHARKNGVSKTTWKIGVMLAWDILEGAL